MNFSSVNPATGRRLRSYRPHSRADIEAALRRARSGFLAWRELSFADRARRLRAVAARLRERVDVLAGMATAEMGKPIAQARAEVEKSALVCDYFAAHARGFLAEERPPGAPAGASVVFEPVGPVLAIMPWNFPFWQVFRTAAPVLMAGNAMVLKHAESVSACALAVAQIFSDAGLPRGVFQTLLVPRDRIASLIADPRIRAVTLTGSVAAGRSVAAQAGAAMKKGVFELGGSDAYLILGDADLKLAAETCAQSRLINSGQSCVSAKRFIVVRSVQNEFEAQFVARMASRRVGDPLDPTIDVGPLARRDLRDALHRQVRSSLRRGARLLLGGGPLPGPGFFYSPTVLTDVTRGMPAYHEELFGPVASIIAVRDEAEAVAVANDTPFGLGAAVFTRSRRRARAVAERIESGLVFVNDLVRSDPTLPFGGVKDSGYGRELGPYGIREFVNLKTLWVS